MTAARLWFFDKTRFGRSCDECRKYVYDRDTGEPVLDRTPARKGLPMLLPKGADPPCHECGKTVGLKVRHWQGVSDATPRAYRTLRHYRQCRAVGWAVPDARDGIVMKNAILLRTVEDAAAELRQSDLEAAILRLVRR